MTMQYADKIAKLGGEHAEVVQKSFVKAAEPLIAKGVSSMANIRDIVLAVGPDGVQDLYVFMIHFLSNIFLISLGLLHHC